MMSSEDKSTAGNFRSDKFSGAPVTLVPAPASSPARTASPPTDAEKQLTGEIVRAIIDQAVVGFVQSDLAGRIIFANDRYCEITGYSREDLLGKRWREFTHPDDLPRNIEFFEQMARNQRFFSFEKRYIRKNGEIVWVNVQPSQLRDAGGQVVGGAAFVADVTERKRAEIETLRAKNALEATLKAVPDLIFEIALDGRYLSAHYSRPELLAAPSEVLIGKTVREILPPVAADTAMSALREAQDTGRSYGRVIELQVPQGVSWFELSISRKANAAGQEPSFIVVSRDITTRVMAENAMKANAEKYRLLFENSRDALMTLAMPSWKFTSANRSTLRMFGAASEAEFTSLSPWDISPERQPDGQNSIEKASQMIETAIREGSNFFEWMHKRLDGRTFPAEVLLTRMEQDGRVSMQATVRDISGRKRLEREILERRNEMAELLKLQVAAQTASAFAHELNQPLLAIASYSEAALMLLNGENPNMDKFRKAIEGSARESHRAGQSIRELLGVLSMKDFSTETFDIIQEIHATLDAARSENEMEFHFALLLQEEIPLIRANRIHLQRVLLNLLRNGIEAAREGGKLPPSITMTMRAKKDENLIQLTIQDNGPGFKKEDIQHLFQPFFTTKARGLGMGLAISRSLIEANGGRLWVDPQQGCGASFHLTLPFAI